MDTDALKERISLTPTQFLGEKIRKARKASGLSHDRLGERVGATRQHLIALEKGDHRPRPRLLLAIAEHTEKPIGYFVKGGDAPFRANGRG